MAAAAQAVQLLPAKVLQAPKSAGAAAEMATTGQSSTPHAAVEALAAEAEECGWNAMLTSSEWVSHVSVPHMTWILESRTPS